MASNSITIKEIHIGGIDENFEPSKDEKLISFFKIRIEKKDKTSVKLIVNSKLLSSESFGEYLELFGHWGVPLKTIIFSDGENELNDKLSQVIIEKLLSKKVVLEELNLPASGRFDHLEELFKSSVEGLKKMSLAGIDLPEHRKTSVLASLGYNKTLEHIDLSNLGLTDDDIRGLGLTLIVNRTIQSVVLCGNSFGKGGILAIVEMMKRTNRKIKLIMDDIIFQ
jgi:hypothetical protein